MEASEEKCRICSASRTTATLYNLSQNCVTMLRSIYPKVTLINPNDTSTPPGLRNLKSICQICRSKLTLAYEFQQKVIETEEEILASCGTKDHNQLAAEIIAMVPESEKHNQESSKTSNTETVVNDGSAQWELIEPSHKPTTLRELWNSIGFEESNLSSCLDETETLELVPSLADHHQPNIDPVCPSKTNEFEPDPEKSPKLHFYACGFCHKTFRSNTDLQRHSKNNFCNVLPVKHVPKDAVKDICGTINKGGNELYICKLCRKESRRKDSIMRHIKFEHFRNQVKTIYCVFCKHKTFRRDHMTAHMSMVHKDELNSPLAK